MSKFQNIFRQITKKNIKQNVKFTKYKEKGVGFKDFKRYRVSFLVEYINYYYFHNKTTVNVFLLL